jgi:hypothetical protein
MIEKVSNKRLILVNNRVMNNKYGLLIINTILYKDEFKDGD